MGYFSQKQIGLAEREARLSEWGIPTEEAVLAFRLEDLTARLDEMNERRPHDPLHPLYDRFFYEDCKTPYDETPDTVQGLLSAIREVERLLRKAGKNERRCAALQTAIEKTGAAPGGQTVLRGLFPPEPLGKAV